MAMSGTESFKAFLFIREKSRGFQNKVWEQGFCLRLKLQVNA
ncbi:hypothetical protein LEP1GSC061_3865 [Leptospira wolffii serovar Khorat str. Khorat-H2]|nr:hypothetical protein LEP1GSC061_3865 [Leptospira wolffii serovar Khorat str. Khorat-H2]